MNRIRIFIAALGIAAFLAGCGELDQLDPEIFHQVDQYSTPIVGGTTTTDWDSTVLLYLGGGMCSGTLISPDVVLTASHCLEGVYGTVDVYWCDDCVNQGYYYHRTSTDYHQHPQYNSYTMVNDIAVVVLDSNGPGDPIPFNRDAASNTWLGSQHPLTFVGFGQTSGSNYNSAGIKREVDIVVDNWDNGFLYYYDSQHQTCFGDSGGPAFTDHSGSWRVAAVTSYGDENCSQMGASTRADAYDGWIDGYTGGWMPGTDDDDAAGDDDDAAGDDDDAAGDDDDAVGDDDDDATPPPADLPEPQTRDDYAYAAGCSCIDDHAPGPAPRPLAAVAALLLALALRRRR